MWLFHAKIDVHCLNMQRRVIATNGHNVNRLINLNHYFNMSDVIPCVYLVFKIQEVFYNDYVMYVWHCWEIAQKPVSREWRYILWLHVLDIIGFSSTHELNHFGSWSGSPFNTLTELIVYSAARKWVKHVFFQCF